MLPTPFTEAEITALRADTPACSECVFLNNAGASLQPQPVVERVIEHLRLEQRIGGYEAADQCAAELDTVYPIIAQLIHAKPTEIAITESATRAWDMAFYGLHFAPGDQIVTAQNEYSSNYIAFLQMSRRSGAEIVVAPPTSTGEIDLAALGKILQSGRVKLVALTHIATNNGMVQPIEEVGKITRAHGVPFLLDACQSTGQLALDVNALGCDMLSGTGRKFLRAPRGTGFLYVRESMLPLLDPPFLDMHSANWSATDEYTMRPDARRFEAWESSASLALGLATAARYAIAIGTERIEARVQMLAAKLRERLADIAGVNVTDTGSRRSGIVLFIHESIPSATVVRELAAIDIITRISPRFGTRLDQRLSALDELVRASIHYYNTEAEIEEFGSALEHILHRHA